MRKIEHRPPPPPPQPIAPPGMAKVCMTIRLPTGGKLDFEGIISAEAAGAAFLDIVRAAENEDTPAAG